MSKGPEFPQYHPTIDLELGPNPLRKPTWLDRIFSPGDIARIRFETPLEAEQGMTKRQQMIVEELKKIHDKPTMTLDPDKARLLGQVIEVYTLLVDEVARNKSGTVMIRSEVAASLHIIKTEFDIELPQYEVFFEEE